MRSFYKKMTGVLCSIAFITTSVLPVYADNDTSDSFDQFLEDEFIELMESDYMTMHYTVKDYASLGIERPDPTIGEATIESYQESVDDANETLDALKKFDYDALSETQKHDYDTYRFYVENMRDLNLDYRFEEIFSPSSGIQENLLTNFTEFVFYDKQDVEDYLSVLESVPGYMDDAMEITKKQAEQGYFLTDSALDDTLDGIEKFVAKKEDNQLITIFNENVDALAFLSSEEKEDFKAQNRDLILNAYIPAYQKIAGELETLRGSRKQSGGMAGYGEDGEKYYRALVRYKTSSDMSVEDQVELGTEFMSDLIDDLMSLYYSDRDVDDKYDSEEIPQESPEEILDYLQSHLQDYPEGPEVIYHPSYLDPSVANDTTVAYYLQPPFDDLKDNVIKINGDNISNRNDLYETLAHEGFPGHLYQITWYLNTKPAHIRSAISNIGYTEGWAMYTEISEWLYADIDETAQKAHQIYTALGYVENAVADLGVNGLNWSKEDLRKWIDELGLNSSASDYLYDYVVENPGLILPYGMGLVHFFNLKRSAKESLGSSFNLKDFNTVLLTYGDRPFEIVKSDVDQYIENLGATVVEPEKDSHHSITEIPASQTSGFTTWLLVWIVTAVVVIFIFIMRKRHGKKNPVTK